MIYQAVSLTEISQSACEDAKVKEAKEKSFYCMYIIWGRLLDALQSPSEIALTMLALCRAMRQRNRSFWLFKKKKKRSNSFQNLGKSLNSVMLNQKRLQIYHRVIIDSLLWTFTKKYNNKYSSLSKQQSTEKNNAIFFVQYILSYIFYMQHKIFPSTLFSFFSLFYFIHCSTTWLNITWKRVNNYRERFSVLSFSRYISS